MKQNNSTQSINKMVCTYNTMTQRMTLMERIEVIETSKKTLENFTGLKLVVEGGGAGKKGHWFALRETNGNYLTDHIIGIGPFTDQLRHMSYLSMALNKQKEAEM